VAGGIQQYIPVVGEPVAFGIGFVVLVLVAFAAGLADSVVTVTHEGGHMLTLLLTGRGVAGFTLEEKEDRVDGGTSPVVRDGWISNVIVGFSGYPAPSLAGLGGAYVIADGNSWGVLWIGIVLLAAALLVARNTSALVITGAALAGLIWAAVVGSPTVQAAVAVGLVWLLLIGGLRRIVLDGSRAHDAGLLAGWTWIPRFAWAGIWLAIGIVSLWVGGRVLLGYEPGAVG
jgi:Peptidase M50B-like